MTALRKLFQRRTAGVLAGRSTSARLYARIVEQARHRAFYTDLGVPDTPDGRFDMLMLHAVLVFRRLRREHGETGHAAQALFDLMFADMDHNLREMGVGDLGVGKRVKAMAKALYGRLATYGAALDAHNGPNLAEAIRRNIYRHSSDGASHAEAVAAYAMREASLLDRSPAALVMAGEVTFGAPDAAADA